MPRDRLAAAKRYTPLYALTHLQLRGRIDPVDPLVIRDDTFAAQQNVKPSIPEAPPFCGKIAEALPQRRIIR